jgi:hypothetical protein
MAAAVLCAFCGACELGGAWADEKRELAPVVFRVRQPPADLAAAGLAGAPLLAQPAAAPDGSEARPFPTLHAALEAAPAGALLRVAEGVWRERLSIRKPVVLIGRGAGRTRIVPAEGGRPAIEVRGADRVELRGLSIEGSAVAIWFEGGTGHRLENVELRGSTKAGLVGRGAEIAWAGGEVNDVGGGKEGRGIDLDGGSIEARRLALRQAGRRAVVLHKARGLLEDLSVRGSTLSAVQATDGADARVVNGDFEGMGGAALYAGGARLSIQGARVRNDEFGVIGFRNAEISVLDAELTDYRVAGVAMVNSHGTVQRTTIGRGGTEAGISITKSDGKVPILLVDNRIHDPGTMGVHITESAVTARGNTITGARLDREKDMGDAFYALDSDLILESNVLRGNAGSGVATLRSKVKLSGNGFIGNGRAGVLLLDRSRGMATRNLFERNARAGLELGEQSRARLVQNHFAGNTRLDIDVGCGKGLAGVAEVDAGNTFAEPIRRRICRE